MTSVVCQALTSLSEPAFDWAWRGAAWWAAASLALIVAGQFLVGGLGEFVATCGAALAMYVAVRVVVVLWLEHRQRAYAPGCG